MNDVLVAHRFQRLVPLHAGGDLRLDLARDVASDTLGSLLTVGPKVESAGELSLRVRLKFFEGGPLFRPMLPLTVVRSAEGLHLLLPPIEAHPWESQLLAAEGALAVGDLRIILDGLKRHEDAGCPAGGLKLDMLYRDEQGPFFLPLAYVLPSPSSFSYHDRLLCRQESRELREELGGLCRRYLKMAGGRLSGEQRRQGELIQAELVAEEPEPPAPRPLRPLVQTLEALREEGGALIVKGGARSLHEAAEVITAWARISERRLAILRPHVCSPVQRYRRGGGQEHGPVILLRNYSSYAPFAQSLQYLRSMDWLSQREIVVVLVEASTSGEASRLFLEGLRGKGSERGFEWNLPGDGSPSAPKQEAGEGLAGRILEALQVARRPLSGEFLRRAFSIRPTHQAVEQIPTLRMIPNMSVWRPCDAVESAVSWQQAIEKRDGPSCLIFSRQDLAHQTRTAEQMANITKGGYILGDCGCDNPDAIIIATGSEVALAMDAAAQLSGKKIRVVSMPSTNVFDAQDDAYKASVLKKGVPTLAVEAAVTDGWYKYADKVVGIDHFGESAPAPELFKEFGFTVENVVAAVESLL